MTGKRSEGRAPRISLCIPAYEMRGMGAHFLSQSFDRLARQTMADFEIVVADQSEDDAVARICDDWSNRLSILRIDTRKYARNASANTNAALDAASAPVLKILFQDDLLVDDDALQRTEAAFAASDAAWLLTGSCLTPDGVEMAKPMRPRLNSKMHFGRNTVSSPSVLAIRRSVGERFREELIWLMDVEYYYRLFQTYGAPAIVDDILVANRIHDDQVSASVTKELKAHELDLVWRQHGANSRLSGKVEYLRRRMKTLF